MEGTSNSSVFYVVNNNGETLYRLLFKQCVLNDVYPGRFDYKSTALHTLSLALYVASSLLSSSFMMSVCFFIISR